MNQPKRQAAKVIQEPLSEEVQRKLLQKERRELEEERRRFKQEQREFYLKQEMERKRLAEENRLFQMKWKILEGELRRFAEEKQEMERQKQRNSHKAERYQKRNVTEYTFQAEMFFSGVDSELALKKRYRELIKIYHPDNMAGDTETLQVINRMYDSLKKQFTA